MASILERTIATDRVAGIIQLVRRRWRLRHVIAGLGVVVALTIVALWLAAMAMERAGFSEASITGARLVVAVVMIAVGLRWIAWPIARRLSDGRVALYAEERIPSLDGALMSAVEATSDAVPVESRASSLTNGLVDDAVRRLRPHGNGVAVESPDIRRSGLVLAAVALFGFGAFMLGPDYLRYGAALIATPWKKAAEVAPYSIAVEPGNATVPKGTDLQVTAQLNGFTSELVEVVTRRGANSEWERIPMGLGSDTTRFSARLFDLDADVEYYIESSGVRSGVFKLTVRNLPAVRKIDLELRYPAYTGLEVERIEDGGDIAAVRGTRVRVSVRATMPVRAGRLVFEGDSSVAMQRSNDSTLVGELVVREDGFYRVELTAEDGTKVAGSVEYVVDALDDMAPTIAIRKPGRDIRPTNVEEVFVEVEATDDFAVGKVELVYSVNGQAEKTLVLNDSAGTRSKDFIAGHTFFLEELGLQAGDVVSYFARATDGTGAREGQQATTDIYFMTVRPFGRDYRQNQQGGGGGGGGANPGALTQQQRDIVAATFKAERDRGKTPPVTFRENVTTIHLGQGRLREQVDELATRMNRPVVAQADTLFKVIADYLKKASEEMKGAEEQLSKRDTKEALPPEQRALQMLERAEAVYRDVQVSTGGGGGGGGGQQQESNAEDLADLFELETDKLRNQYEQVQRGEQQQAQQQVDETLERLKQLAARQQQENERARQRAQSMAQQGGGSGGGGGQRQLADQADSLARQLERLAREQRSQEMAESARRLQEAANEMRRAASQQGQGSSAGSALDQIENARRLLEEARQSGQAGGIEDAARRAQDLANQQRDVARDVQELANAGAARSEREQRLDERKTGMAGEVQQLQSDIERMSRDLARDRPEAARDLREAARGMREGRLSDKIQFSRGVMRQGAADYVRNWEQSITDDLDSLSSRLDRANSTASGKSQGNEAQTLDRARDLVRGLSSIDDRMRDRENQAGSQQGQQGQQGQGQQAQGQQGQGQQGQGQQGQGQQGQGQQGQGQQGQGQQGQQGQGQGQGQQGQGGQGGRQGQGGQSQRGLDPAGGNRGGAQIGGGGAQGGGPRGPYTGEDVRQYGRELRSQRDAAEALRRELQGQGRNVEDLTNLIEQLRRLEGARAFNDPDELARLRSAVVEGFKEFEFTLRRQLAGVEADRPALGGNENVPPGYRDMVNEYFKSLSRKPTAPPPVKKPEPPR